MNPIWLMRMAQWVRNPPSWQRVVLILSVVAVCLAIFGFEYFFGWPDWMTVNRPPRVNP